MAENHPDDLDALLDASAADQLQTGLETADAVDASDANGPSDGSGKDTLETADLQAELAADAENTVAFGGSSADAGRGLGNSGMTSRDSGEGVIEPGFIDQENDSTNNAKKDPIETKLIRDLESAKRTLNELMSWKEDLRLLAMQHNTLGAYYDHWTKEANLFFRRVVIINKRLETQRKKKRA